MDDLKFRGLSSPEELKETWHNMTEGQEEFLPLDVVWSFDGEFLETINDGLYVCNLLYPYIGNNTGHYIAIYKNGADVYYFDPLGTLPPKWVNNYLKNYKIDLEGEQKINGNSCGFRCLTKLFKYCLGYFPKKFITIENDKIFGDIDEKTLEKTKREFKILNNL